MVRKSSKKISKIREGELIDGFIELCRSAGIKVTHQRLEVFRALVKSDSHPSAEEVFDEVKKRIPFISLDTVYRTLATLEQQGVLTKIQLGTRTRFDPNREMHHHFICTECHTIQDFRWPRFDDLKAPPRMKAWGEVRTKYVELRGICKACLARKK
ncbi:MAG: Fur family transcriptional regulator [Planctomycetota bacterium]|jgi:Fur family peroxide stress response transcriptional regulator